MAELCESQVLRALVEFRVQGSGQDLRHYTVGSPETLNLYDLSEVQC